jgi:restriction system protein
MADSADDPRFPVGRASNVASPRTCQVNLEATTQLSVRAAAAPLVLQSPEQALPSLTVYSLIVPGDKTKSGLLVKSTSAVWDEVMNALGADWNNAYKIPPERWEEIIAGAFHKEGYEVILTPRTGDHGRDVIATKGGIGSVKILGSVKAYAPDHIVPYDAVRALMGVIASERDTSKGIITTTSDFPPKIESDPFISPLLPTRLELVNGAKLEAWLADLRKK